MPDFLLDLANGKHTAGLLKTLGLPTPVHLRRGSADPTRPLAGTLFLTAAAAGGYALPAVNATLKAAGARTRAALADDDSQVRGVVIDATACASSDDLRLLYDTLHPALRRLERCARVVVIAAPPAQCADPRAAAAARGCEGFVRAIGKEIGKRGATANTLYLAADAAARLGGPLRFFCAPASAYVSGQALLIDSSVAAVPVLDDGGLGGKVALVTGAARGIGAAIARRLAAAGARVICVDLAGARDPLYELALQIGGLALVHDITANPAGLAGFVAERCGGLDLLVHNAGITRDKTLANMPAALWEQVLAVNLQAIFEIDAALDAAALLRAGGREICLSSISGIAGNYGQSNYALSKAALIGYVAARARQLAPRGVTINAIAPGFIETPMTQAIPPVMREFGRRLNSLAQGGQPADVAEAVGFLAGPDALGVSGQTLRVCGQALVGA